MIKIACLLDKKNGTVAYTFAEAKHAVFMDAEEEKFLKEIPRGKMSEEEFARALIAEEPEAVITGPLEQVPFEIIAEEGMVTRYDGGGLKTAEAVKLMNEYRLGVIADFIGGTGCHSGGECHEHH